MEPTTTTTTPAPIIPTHSHAAPGKEAKVIQEVRYVDRVDLLKVILFIFVTSAAVLIEAARICHDLERGNRSDCKDENAFAVAVGGFGVLLSLLLMIVIILPAHISRPLCQVFGILLAAAWIAGAGILTFRTPFTYLGNGYFGSWLAFDGSLYFLYLVVPEVDRFFDSMAAAARTRDIDHRTVFSILVASVVELTAAALLCDRLDYCKNRHAWAVAVGAFSSGWTLLFLLFYRFLVPFRIFFALILVIVWIPGTGILTFDDPFTGVGNGYFASWVALFFSGYWAVVAIARNP